MQHLHGWIGWLGIAAGKQPVLGPGQAPVGAQDAQQLRREHDVAVLAALALLDADHHAAAVDVGDLEADRLRGAQARRIGRGQRGAVLQARHRLEEAHDLVGAQHHRQLAAARAHTGSARASRPAERHAIEEAQGADRLVQRRPRHPAGHQMHLKGAHVLETEPLRRAAEKPAELRHGMDVGSLRRRRQIADASCPRSCGDAEG